MHTVSYYLSFLFYSVSALPLHTHLQSLQKLLQKWVAHYRFLLPRLFIYIFANEELAELVREKPLTQFPVSLLEVCLQHFYQSIQMEKKSFLDDGSLMTKKGCSPIQCVIRKLHLLQAT